MSLLTIYGLVSSHLKNRLCRESRLANDVLKLFHCSDLIGIITDEMPDVVECSN